LLKLGFIGDEYKDARRTILAGLGGDGSHKSAKRKFETDDNDSLVRGGLCCVPPTDCNYASYLRDATDAQLREAIEYMESNPQGNNGRIAACSRELKNRGAL
jgi:hypothetical protein